MKKTIINIIMFVQALFSSQMVCAQQNGYLQQRRVIDAALNTIDGYSVWSAVANDEAHYEFQDLFVSNKVLIYNDLLGIKQEDLLSVEDYTNTMRYALRNKKIFIKYLFPKIKSVFLQS